MHGFPQLCKPKAVCHFKTVLAGMENMGLFDASQNISADELSVRHVAQP